jgi:hypothetical protein
MKVKCISTDGKTLPQECHNLGYTNDSVFNIRINSEYAIYGVCWWRGILLYLACDETLKPNWYPANLFSIIETKVPENWEFNTINSDEYSTKVVLGYPELLIESHYNGLIERNQDDLKIFYREKSIVDKMYT